MSSNNVVGVNFGRNAPVALAVNGEVVFALAEACPRGFKNVTGFSVHAYEILLERSFANGPGKICFVVFSAATNQEQRFHLEGNTSLSGFFYRSHKETEENRIPEFSLKSSGYDSESYIKRCEMIAADRTRRSLFWGTKPAAWGQRSSHV